ncbi:MAG TPA: hypothetical protein VGF75_04790 [Candidatus Saccharimonadales bacterium]
MLIPLILVVHITLAFSIAAGFIYRYVSAFKNKIYPTSGRKAMFGGLVGLVTTGVLLSVIGKLPITGLCLDSLGLVIAFLVMEVGLQKLSGRLATEKNIIDKK